jgi:hypothetical protein
MGRFETGALIQEVNLAALGDPPGRWLEAVHARYTIFQMAEAAVPRAQFRRILEMINQVRLCRTARCRRR